MQLSARVTFVSCTGSAYTVGPGARVSCGRRQQVSPRCNTAAGAGPRVPDMLRGSHEQTAAAPRRRRPGEGPSTEYLSVSGTLATTLGAMLVGVISLGMPAPVFSNHMVRILLASSISFMHTLGLCQFDLRSARKLCITLIVVMSARILVLPIVGVCVSKFVHIYYQHSLPIDALQFSLATPPLFGPSTALLAVHAYPTLLAQLSVCTLVFAPLIVPMCWAIPQGLARILPGLQPVVPMFTSPLLLLISTTLPALAALMLYRGLPRRVGAPVAFIALPIAWLLSAPLLAMALRAVVVQVNLCQVAVVAGVYSGVAAITALCAYVLAKALGLDKRARRSLLLFMTSQGALFGAAAAPMAYPAMPPVVAAVVGLVVTCVLARRWSVVIVRQK